MQEEEVSNLKYMTIEEMEKAYRNRDNRYAFISWSNIDKMINELKEIRDSI